MRSTSAVRGQGAAGFSLLEMVVALSILALSLGALYQAVGGATRHVRSDEKYAYGVELARSLLAENARVPASGKNLAGETQGGFQWHVQTHPLDIGRTARDAALLHEIEVGVSWHDGAQKREVVLNSVVEGYFEGSAQ